MLLVGLFAKNLCVGTSLVRKISGIVRLVFSMNSISSNIDFFRERSCENSHISAKSSRGICIYLFKGVVCLNRDYAVLPLPHFLNRLMTVMMHLDNCFVVRFNEPSELDANVSLSDFFCGGSDESLGSCFLTDIY